MKKHLIVVGTAVLLLAVGLSGCEEINHLPSEEDRFVGTWKDEHGATITFFSDGEGSMETGFVWEIKDSKTDNIIVIETQISGVLAHLIYYYQFSDGDTTLTLTGLKLGTTQIYTKQQ